MDDFEKAASHAAISALNSLIETRPVFIPRRPSRSLDASSFTEDQLRELIRLEAEESASSQFEPWILEFDGKKHLPAFSSLEKLEAFVKRISHERNKVFAIDSAELLIGNVTNAIEIDFIDLNLFSEPSWQIALPSASPRDPK